MTYNTDVKIHNNSFQIGMKRCRTSCPHYLAITNASDLWTCAKLIEFYSCNREQNNGVTKLKNCLKLSQVGTINTNWLFLES